VTSHALHAPFWIGREVVLATQAWDPRQLESVGLDAVGVTGAMDQLSLFSQGLLGEWRMRKKIAGDRKWLRCFARCCV
jgi:hypothetical protein